MIDLRDSTIATDVVGLIQNEAEGKIVALGGMARVVSIDGKSYAIIADYRVDRVDLWLENGIVTYARVS
jgi:hypothetical protein